MYKRNKQSITQLLVVASNQTVQTNQMWLLFSSADRVASRSHVLIIFIFSLLKKKSCVSPVTIVLMNL